MPDFFRHDTAIVGKGARIGTGTRIWAFTNIQEGAVVGRDCNIGDGCYVEKGAVIGDGVTVKNGVAVFDGVTIEDEAFVGVNVAFINDRFPRKHTRPGWTLEKTLVRRGASVGSNATLLCGVTIGEFAFVGAGSVVTRDVPPYRLVFGNPAAPRGFVCRCGNRLDEALRCSCGSAYRRDGDGLAPA